MPPGALPFLFIAFLFQVWMFVDAIRREAWLWAVLILLFSFVTAALYFFLVYRPAVGVEAPVARGGGRLPGSELQERIQELERQIELLDNAHQHRQLGDIRLEQGDLARAENCYRAALERDSSDADTHAGLGRCLLRMQRPQEALPYLEMVCHENPEHDYGQTMMLLADGLSASGRRDEALAKWQEVARRHSYPQARVRLAELYLDRGNTAPAQAELREVLSDFESMPAYQRRREAEWIRKAEGLMGRLRRSGGLSSAAGNH